jgi:hypothetical protein
MAKAYEGGKASDFHISEKWLKLYQSICRRGRARSEGYSVFDKYTNLYTLCASIGYMIQNESDLEKPYSPFTLEQVDENTEWPVLRSIAWSTANNRMDIFINSKEVIRVCDRFAEAGIQKLYDDFFKDHMQDGILLRPDSVEMEINLCYIVEGIRKNANFL